MSLLTNLPLLLAQQRDNSFWMPPPASTSAGAVDDAFYLIYYISLFFFLLIVALMLVFVVLYRRRPGIEQKKAPAHSTALEVTWTIIPLLVVIYIFYSGFTGYLEMRTVPRDAYEIQVTARQYNWTFTYPNGYESPNLHMPAGEPVMLLMKSEDVIHSLWVPDFRVKMDLVPGHYTRTWFEAPEPGVHDLVCTEYCGTGHSAMLATVVVQPPSEFRAWLADAAKFAEGASPAERGQLLFRNQGCASCHSVDEARSAKVGPPLWGVFGETHQFTDGGSAVVDENYLRESILNPNAKIREGYRAQMNSYQGLLDDQQVMDLIQYIKALRPGGMEEAKAAAAAEKAGAEDEANGDADTGDANADQTGADGSESTQADAEQTSNGQTGTGGDAGTGSSDRPDNDASSSGDAQPDS